MTIISKSFVVRYNTWVTIIPPPVTITDVGGIIVTHVLYLTTKLFEIMVIDGMEETCERESLEAYGSCG